MPADPRPDNLYNIILSLPASLDEGRVASLAPELGERALATSAIREGNVHTADWIVTWLMDGEPDQGELMALLPGLPWYVEKVADVNWLAHSYRQFQPFSIGAFFIYGSHYDGALPPDKMPLQIDAATAFGSGEHGTTAGCLRALLSLKGEGFAPRTVLDMGTGSGILAIAARRLWDVPVLATDIDEESVIVAARHAQMNGIDDMTCLAGDGFAVPQVRDGAPYDLIIANILAGPLIAMAADLCAVLRGKVVLSGMLEEQADEVRSAYEARGCRLVSAFPQAPWTTLLLEKSAA